jgi:3-methyladenine DNA glycosylase AlkD
MTELKKHGSEQTRKIFARHGLPADRMFGVSVAQQKLMAKSLKGQQALALELYETGNVDAMYLAGLVADGAAMSRKQLNDWAKGAAGMQMISEYTVAWVAVESDHGRALALEWIKSKNEQVAASGWCTYAGLLATIADEELDLKEVETLLGLIEKRIDGAANRVRYTMNGFVIAAGTYVTPLREAAKKTAQNIGAVSVNLGETACKVPLALAAIEKAVASGKAGKKKKTIRC